MVGYYKHEHIPELGELSEADIDKLFQVVAELWVADA